MIFHFPLPFILNFEYCNTNQDYVNCLRKCEAWSEALTLFAEVKRVQKLLRAHSLNANKNLDSRSAKPFLVAVKPSKIIYLR
jgi:hypothetical protein